MSDARFCACRKMEHIAPLMNVVQEVYGSGEPGFYIFQ